MHRHIALTAGLTLGLSLAVWAQASPGGPNVRVAPPVLRGGATEPPNQVAPDLAVDPGGQLYCVWAEGREGAFDIRLARSDDRGKTFGAPVQVNGPGEEAVAGWQEGPQVAVQGQGNVLVLWLAKQGGIHLARSADGGKTFSPSVLVSQGLQGRQTYPSFAVDQQGDVYVAWLGARNRQGEPPHSQVYFSKSTDGGRTFSPDRALTPQDAFGVCHCCRTAVAVGPNGMVVVAYRNLQQDSIRDIFAVVSRDEGKTFSAPLRVATGHWRFGGCPADGPALNIDQVGRIHVAWMDGRSGRRHIYYAVSEDGRAFGENVRISPEPTLEEAPPRAVLGSGGHPALAIGPGNRAYVAWEGARGDGNIFAARSEGGSVSVPKRLNDVPGRRRSYPTLESDREGAVFAAWMDPRDGASRIYLSAVVQE